MAKLNVGDRAPDFSLQTNRATQFKLSELKCKNLVLFFYPMDESPICSKEIESFKERYEEFKAMHAEVVGISSQSVESHRSFAAKHSLPYLLLSDPSDVVRKLYGVSSRFGIPGRVTFVIDREGVVVFIYSSQLHPARHAQEALDALKKT